MSDLSALIADLCDGLGAEDTAVFPAFPGSFPGGELSQETDNKHFSRSSRFSRSENKGVGSEIKSNPESSNFLTDAHARASSYVGEPGNPGKPGNDEKTLAGSTPLSFPVEFLEPGKPGKENKPCGRPILDLNNAKPQRSDWWTGDLMVEADHASPPPGDPLPISPSDVRAGVARELRVLAEDGREGPAALRDAVEITRAKIRNSEALAERQANGAACHVCDEALDDILPVIAVLSGKPGAHLFLHAACHDAYRARRTVLVNRIMASAGYGETLTNGEAI